MRSEMPKKWLKKCSGFCLLLVFCFSLFTFFTAFAAEPTTIETRVTDFIKRFYSDRNDIYIKLNLPASLKDNMKVRHIDFAKIPDSNGDGMCLVEVAEKNGRTKNIYLSFKVSNKKKIFVLKQSAKKGDVLRLDDIYVKEVFMNSNGGSEYPLRIEDVSGKTLKKNMNAGVVITNYALEDSFVVQRGDTVSIVAENKKLMVTAKGKTLERGKMGDMIRVKNLSSNKEITGRITGSGTVRVDL